MGTFVTGQWRRPYNVLVQDRSHNAVVLGWGMRASEPQATTNTAVMLNIGPFDWLANRPIVPFHLPAAS